MHVRDSGGTAVPHGAGILNLSLLLPRTTTNLAHYYRLLGAPLLTLLAEYGLEGSYDFVPGSFCDGQYNLVMGDARSPALPSAGWRRAGSPGRRAGASHAAGGG